MGSLEWQNRGSTLENKKSKCKKQNYNVKIKNGNKKYIIDYSKPAISYLLLVG